MTKKLASHIGEVAREARLRAQLTQQDVAERVGIATEVYGRLERGNMLPSVGKLQTLCQVLRLDANLVLGLSASAERQPLEAPPPVEDQYTPEVRRLLRHLRQLPRDSVRLLTVVAAHLLKREKSA